MPSCYVRATRGPCTLSKSHLLCLLLLALHRRQRLLVLNRQSMLSQCIFIILPFRSLVDPVHLFDRQILLHIGFLILYSLLVDVAIAYLGKYCNIVYYSIFLHFTVIWYSSHL